MGLFECSISPKLSNNANVVALESTLQLCISNFKDLLLDFEQLQIECENYKLQYTTLKNKCDSKTCNAAEDFRNTIASKDLIIQSVASSLTKLNETKDWNVLTETFKILFEDSWTIKCKDDQEYKISPKRSSSNDAASKVSFKNDQASKISPKAQLASKISPKGADISVTEDVSLMDESSCEIEGTPTGRTSPIIQTTKTKNVLGISSDFRDKKKCLNDWPTPKSKSIKLTYPTTAPKRGKVNLRQSRLNLVRVQQTSVVDLTCSPEFCGGRRTDTGVPLIKKESVDSDDTIMPSPTSEHINLSLLKHSKECSSKFKRPLGLNIKKECEDEAVCDGNGNVQNNDAGMEHSINILQLQLPNRLRNSIKKEMGSPLKAERVMEVDATHCDTNSSLSLLDHVSMLARDNMKSPAKQPLAENINIMNTPPRREPDSMSLLQPQHMAKASTNAIQVVKRKLPELVEPIYKEPTVRNKTEKRNLQGWSCEQCKNFYGELYKDDAVMLAKKINECSKHRGRHNPERPSTPPNFWNPRWHVPADTEELNIMNNAN